MKSRSKAMVDKFSAWLGHCPKVKDYLRPHYYRLKGEPTISYSAITEDVVRRCIDREDPVILEIGCNDGTHTRWFLEMFPRARIYCFEPDPRAAARFKKAMISERRAHLFEMALSAENGEATLHMSDGKRSEHLPEGWDKSSSLRRPALHLAEHTWCVFEKSQKVKTRTLDSWAAEQKVAKADFVWMDVQGAELDVINGGKNLLRHTRFLYTEYGITEQYEGQAGIKDLLSALPDYKSLVRYPSDILLWNTRFGMPPGIKA